MRNPVSFVPRSAIESVRRHGLLSGQSLLGNREALAAAAAGRGGSADDFAGGIRAALSGWKPTSAQGANVMFAAPPPSTDLGDNHPLRKHDLVAVRVRLSQLLRDLPDTKVHGSELVPYDEEADARLGDAYPDLRHRDLTPEEVRRLRRRKPESLWRHFRPSEQGYYAADVPHAALITPGGGIDPKYLQFPKEAGLLDEVQLQPHQQRVYEGSAREPARKLLNWGLGSGKSLGSLAAAEAYGRPYTAIVPAALRPTYVAERKKFTDQSTPAQVMSYSELARGKDVQYPESLVFDESHRLRNPGGAASMRAADLARKAKQVLLLSGTPLVNAPGDFAPLMAMLTGRHISPEDFEKRYVGTREVRPSLLQRLRGITPGEEPAIKHEDELRALLKGHVDYYSPDKPVVPVTREDVAVEMGPEQTQLYKAMWDQLPFYLRWKLQNQFPLSRQELIRLRSFLSGPRQVGLSTMPYLRDKDPRKAYAQSTKLQKAVGLMQERLTDPRVKGLVFSNFIDAGLRPYAAALEDAGVPHGLFHGGLNDRERAKLVDDYNTGKIRVALLGPSGTEGLSFKGTQLLQQLDDHFHPVRPRQAEGRGLRYDSHSGLPEDLKNVHVQRFASRLPAPLLNRVLSRVGLGRAEPTPAVDDHLRAMAGRKEKLNSKFLSLLREIGTPQHQEIAS